MCIKLNVCRQSKTSGASPFKMLKDVGMEVSKGIETKKQLCSKTGDDGMKQ